MRARCTDAASQRRGQTGRNASFTPKQNDISIHYAWEGASPNDLLRTASAGEMSPHTSVIVQLQFLTCDATVRGGRDPWVRKTAQLRALGKFSFWKMAPVFSHWIRTTWLSREKGLETALKNNIYIPLWTETWSCQPHPPTLSTHLAVHVLSLAAGTRREPCAVAYRLPAW